MIDQLIVYVISFFGGFVSIWFLLSLLENSSKIRHKGAKKFPSISILIPAFNEENAISKTIESVLGLDYPREKLDVIIIDDGSTDRTYEVAKKFEKDGVRVFRKKNGGKASALNFGMQKASGELILSLDADTFLDRNSLKSMVGYFESSKVMCVTPMIKVHKPKKLLEILQFIEYSIMNFTRNILMFSNCLNIAPAASLFRKTFFNRYGGFDEKNLTEDFEIGLRIQSNNYNIKYAFDAEVFTKVPNTLKKLLRQRIRWTYGAFSNLGKYRHMIGFKYGDLGFFILPILLIFTGISIFASLYAVSKLVVDSFNLLNFYQLVGFDLTYALNSNTLSLLNSLTSTNFFLLLFLLLTGITTFVCALKFSKVEGKSRLYYASYIFYALAYGWILSIFYILGLYYFVRNKNPGW